MVRQQTVPELDELVDRMTERLESGVEVDLAALLREYPQYEQRLRELFPGLQKMARLGRYVNRDLEPDALGGLQAAGGRNGPVTLGDYEILEEVGRGGMGIVFRARQRTLQRVVALKVLPLASLADDQQLTRFHNEARAAATLQHPHIVPVYSVGEQRGIHFYSMPYVNGPTLGQLLQLLRTGKSANLEESAQDCASDPASRTWAVVPRIINSYRCSRPTYYRLVARWGWQVADALANAHQHGIVHRDIKPGNVLLDEKGSIWITDFGLARLDLGTTVTASGAVMGTWRYMSPEQASGQRSLVDHRTDIYSLGVTLYEALTLKRAFDGDSRARLVQQITAGNPATPRRIDVTIPCDLQTVVLKAMQRDPKDRYPTAAELADDLQRFLDGKPIRARRTSLWHRLRQWLQRHAELAIGLALALLLALLTVSVAAVWISRAHRQTQAAIAGQDVALQSANEKSRIAREAADAMYRDLPRQAMTTDSGSAAVQRRLLESAVSIPQVLGMDRASRE